MRRIILLVLVAAILCSTASATTITSEVLDITEQGYVSAYNTGITGLLALDAVKSYDVSDELIAYPANIDQDITVLLQTSGDKLRAVSIVMNNSFDSYEEYLAIANRALAIMAPETTQQERYEAIMTVIAGGITRNALQDYGQNVAYMGANNEYILVYYMNGNQRQLMGMKGTIE